MPLYSGAKNDDRTTDLYNSFTSLGGGMGGAAGGLCDRRAYGRSFNTLALAHATADENERIPERIAALTLAHEMGEIIFVRPHFNTSVFVSFLPYKLMGTKCKQKLPIQTV